MYSPRGREKSRRNPGDKRPGGLLAGIDWSARKDTDTDSDTVSEEKKTATTTTNTTNPCEGSHEGLFYPAVLQQPRVRQHLPERLGGGGGTGWGGDGGGPAYSGFGGTRRCCLSRLAGGVGEGATQPGPVLREDRRPETLNLGGPASRGDGWRGRRSGACSGDDFSCVHLLDMDYIYRR